MSADLLGPGYLHEIWSQDACQKAESERVMGQGEGWLQPYGCQRSAKQYHMPENTATTSCILYKQFSSLLSSVKCNVLRHLNKINIAVELYLEISLVKLPARQNMPAFRFLYHLELHLGLSNRLLMVKVAAFQRRLAEALPATMDAAGRLGQTRAGSR